jgi:hypothetical protein
MNNVIPFHYKGQSVQFDLEGWVHATEIAKAFGKEPNGWLVSVDTMSYMVALAQGLGLEVKYPNLQEFKEIKELDSSKASTKARVLRLSKAVGLVRTKAGSPEFGGGTWLHPKLAVVFARWLDIDFAVWCDLHIDALLRGELDEKQQLDRACRALEDGKKAASASGRALALWKMRKPALEHQVDHWRHQLQLTLGLDLG